MDILSNVLAAFGLSSSAGLNAYLPLLVVALAARFTNLVQLRAPWDALENPWVIGALVVSLTAVVLPALLAVILILLTSLAIWLLWRRAARVPAH